MREERLISVARAARRTGVAALARAATPRDNVRVTLTHYVADGHVDRFRRVVEALLEEREPLTPGEVVDLYRGQGAPLRGRRVAFSFDDGLLSSYEAAQRVLEPLGVKALFFVPTAVFELRGEDEMRAFFAQNVYRRASGSLPPERYVTMTLDHARELHRQGHMVLPHTHGHVRLDALDSDALVERELVRPKVLIEDALQAEVAAFAFPFGTERVVDERSYRAVRRTYPVCFTALGGANTAATDPSCLYRDSVSPHLPLDHAANVAAGSFDLYYRLKMRRLRRRAGLA